MAARVDAKKKLKRCKTIFHICRNLICSLGMIEYGRHLTNISQAFYILPYSTASIAN